jgi:hypothetical protein
MRVSLPSEYPTPVWVYGDLWTGTDITNTSYAIYYDNASNSNRRYIAQPNANVGGVVNYANQWSRGFVMVPTDTTSTWSTVAYQSGYNNILMPLYLYCDGYVSGFPDGCYLAPGFALQSENEFTVGSDTYIVFQNCYRTTYADFMAIKEA